MNPARTGPVRSGPARPGGPRVGDDCAVRVCGPAGRATPPRLCAAEPWVPGGAGRSPARQAGLHSFGAGRSRPGARPGPGQELPRDVRMQRQAMPETLIAAAETTGRLILASRAALGCEDAATAAATPARLCWAMLQTTVITAAETTSAVSIAAAPASPPVSRSGVVSSLCSSVVSSLSIRHHRAPRPAPDSDTDRRQESNPCCARLPPPRAAATGRLATPQPGSAGSRSTGAAPRIVLGRPVAVGPVGPSNAVTSGHVCGTCRGHLPMSRDTCRCHVCGTWLGRIAEDRGGPDGSRPGRSGIHTHKGAGAAVRWCRTTEGADAGRL